jgi:hypothetical protein
VLGGLFHGSPWQNMYIRRYSRRIPPRIRSVTEIARFSQYMMIFEI